MWVHRWTCEDCGEKCGRAKACEEAWITLTQSHLRLTLVGQNQLPFPFVFSSSSSSFASLVDCQSRWPLNIAVWMAIHHDQPDLWWSPPRCQREHSTTMWYHSLPPSRVTIQSVACIVHLFALYESGFWGPQTKLFAHIWSQTIRQIHPIPCWFKHKWLILYFMWHTTGNLSQLGSKTDLKCARSKWMSM